MALVLAVRQADPSGDSLVLKTLLAVLGMVFVACGLFVFWRMPCRASLLFAGFCLCSGLHWGGPLDLVAGPLRTVLVLFYVVVSSLLGEVLFLRFALWFPTASRLAARKSVLWFLVALPVTASGLAVLYLLAPSESSLRSAAEQGFFLLITVAGNLLSVVAFGFILSHVFRTDLTGTQKMCVGLMVAGMLIAWVPYLVAEATDVDTAPWTLTFAALPIAFAIAILGIEGTREADRAGRRGGGARPHSRSGEGAARGPRSTLMIGSP